MVNNISTCLALTPWTPVSHQNFLPVKYFNVIQASEMPYDEEQGSYHHEAEVLGYDKHGHVLQQTRRGLFIDSHCWGRFLRGGPNPWPSRNPSTHRSQQTALAYRTSFGRSLEDDSREMPLHQTSSETSSTFLWPKTYDLPVKVQPCGCGSSPTKLEGGIRDNLKH